MRESHFRMLVALGSAWALAGCAGAAVSTAPRPSRNTVAALRAAIDSMTGEPKWRSARWGILIVDPERGDTLVSHDAGKLFIPASNEKLITGSVALAQLGPEFRFTTTFVAAGPIANGVLDGDLIVHGTGDPSVSDAMLVDAMAGMRAIGDSLAARGITRITGGLRTGSDALPGPVLGFGWEWDDLDADYSAGVDELFFNEGFARVTVHAGTAIGDAPTVTTAPARSYPPVRMLATTSASGTRRALDIAMDSTVTGGVVVRGTVAQGDSARLTVAFRDPGGAYLAALREGLIAHGIAVDGGTTSAHGVGRDTTRASRYAIEPAGTPLFTVMSPPLRDVMRAFEKPSQNQIGELLLRTIGRVKTGVGTPDSGLRVVRTQLSDWGVASDGFVARDGSGLSRHDVVSPETLVRVLDAMRKQPSFQIFHDALPIAGVDGTIRNRMRGTSAEGRVHAKTGTLDMVRSLSGYVTTASGRQLLFSVLCNHFTVRTAEVDRVADAIAVRLASLEQP